MRKPSVLLIGNFLSGSLRGRRTVGEDLAAQLRRRGYAVVCASSRRNRLARLADMIGTVWSRRSEYEVAHVEVYSGPAFVWAEAACAALRWAGKPYILALHGGNLPRFSQHWPRRVGRLLRSAAAVVAPSPYLALATARFRSDVRIVPNALDLGAYPYRVRDSVRPKLIWLRSFQEMYNPTLAVRVVSTLAARFADAHLTMIGPGCGDGSLERTRELAARLGVSDRVTFTGAVPKSSVPEWLNRGDIFLNTTNLDNSPVSVLEAMACGLCVVSTDAGGLRYLLQPDVNALLASCGDADAMAALVCRILEQPRVAAGLSREARRTVEGFDWESVLPQWDQMLESAAALS